MRNIGMTSAPFIKFGCIKDHKFGEKMGDYILYKDINGKYLTIRIWLQRKTILMPKIMPGKTQLKLLKTVMPLIRLILKRKRSRKKQPFTM